MIDFVTLNNQIISRSAQRILKELDGKAKYCDHEKAAAVSKICRKCKRVPASTSNLCAACIMFLSRIFAPDAPLIDQELAKILNTVRSSGRERSVKNLATSLSKVIKS